MDAPELVDFCGNYLDENNHRSLTDLIRAGFTHLKRSIIFSQLGMHLS